MTAKNIPHSILRRSIIMCLLCACSAAAAYAQCTITNTNDNGAGSLRQCILDIANGGTVYVPDSMSGKVINLNGAEENGVHFSTAKRCTIQGNGIILKSASSKRFLKVNNPNCTFYYITFYGGVGSGTGGAVFTTYANRINFIRCNFINNSATSGGGAIAGLSPYLTDCNFINNRISGGKGIHVRATNAPSIINTYFVGGNDGIFAAGCESDDVCNTNNSKLSKADSMKYEYHDNSRNFGLNFTTGSTSALPGSLAFYNPLAKSLHIIAENRSPTFAACSTWTDIVKEKESVRSIWVNANTMVRSDDAKNTSIIDSIGKCFWKTCCFDEVNLLPGSSVYTTSPLFKNIASYNPSANGNKKTLIRYNISSTAASYTIPADVLQIGSQAFTGASNLRTIYIHNNVSGIGTCAFASLPNLENIVVDAANPYFASVDGILYDKNRQTLIHYPAAKKGTDSQLQAITSSVIRVLKGAFYKTCQ